MHILHIFPSVGHWKMGKFSLLILLILFVTEVALRKAFLNCLRSYSLMAGYKKLCGKL